MCRVLIHAICAAQTDTYCHALLLRVHLPSFLPLLLSARTIIASKLLVQRLKSMVLLGKTASGSSVDDQLHSGVRADL